MSIRFNCPHCQKTLKVPTEHGGKRARCPGCKKTVNIPSLDPVVAAEIEDLAVAALTDEAKPAQVEEKESRPIKFTCYFCDEEVEVSAELAGQQTPCPECRRIIKVPLPVKTEPLDWRKVKARGPAAGMRRDEPAAPEGAWGSTSLTQVSSIALNEVQALEKPPTTTKQWIKRGVIVIGMVVLVGVGALTVTHFRGQSLQKNALLLAMSSVPESGSSALRSVDAAAIHRGIAEYLIRDGNAAEARKHLILGLSDINSESATSRSPADVEGAALELALTQADIFGTAEQVQNGTRLAWTDAPKEMRATLRAVVSAEARAEALRQLTRKIVAGVTGDTAKNLSETLASHLGSDSDRHEMLAVVGVEMLSAGAKPEAEAVAQRALDQYLAGESGAAGSPTLIALFVGLGQEKAIEQTFRATPPRFDVANPPSATRFGFAVGWALLGNWDRAHQLANSAGPARERWHTLVAVAEIASDKNPDQARKAVEAALELAEKEMGGQVSDGWSLIRLAPIAFRAGMSDRLAKLVESTPDASLRDRARVELKHNELRNSSAVNLEPLKNPSDDGMKPRMLQLIARHAARHGNAAEVLDAVNSWQVESLRPFGQIGVALGLQDKVQ